MKRNSAFYRDKKIRALREELRGLHYSKFVPPEARLVLAAGAPEIARLLFPYLQTCAEALPPSSLVYPWLGPDLERLKPEEYALIVEAGHARAGRMVYAKCVEPAYTDAEFDGWRTREVHHPEVVSYVLKDGLADYIKVEYTEGRRITIPENVGRAEAIEAELYELGASPWGRWEPAQPPVLREAEHIESDLDLDVFDDSYHEEQALADYYEYGDLYEVSGVGFLKDVRGIYDEDTGQPRVYARVVV